MLPLIPTLTAVPSAVAAPPAPLAKPSHATTSETDHAGAAAPVDKVTLSQLAQVRLLSQQGKLTPDIGITLSLPVATVDDDLGISAEAAASASPASGAKKASVSTDAHTTSAKPEDKSLSEKAAENKDSAAPATAASTNRNGIKIAPVDVVPAHFTALHA